MIVISQIKFFEIAVESLKREKSTILDALNMMTNFENEYGTKDKPEEEKLINKWPCTTYKNRLVDVENALNYYENRKDYIK